MKDIVLISRAWNFAAQRHTTQRRKGKAQEPYVNHLAEVRAKAGSTRCMLPALCVAVTSRFRAG